MKKKLFVFLISFSLFSQDLKKESYDEILQIYNDMANIYQENLELFKLESKQELSNEDYKNKLKIITKKMKDIISTYMAKLYNEDGDKMASDFSYFLDFFNKFLKEKTTELEDYQENN